MTFERMYRRLYPAGEPPSARLQVVIAIVMFLFAFAIRDINHQHEPITDELYSVLTAQSWLDDGTFSIAGGTYERVPLYSVLVAVAISIGNDDINAARIFSIIVGSLLVASVAVWVSRKAGLSEGIVAASILAVMPGAIFLSQYIRFYILHALTFWLAATLFYALVSQPLHMRQRLLTVLWTVAMLGISLHLQIITLIGLVGLGLWAIIITLPDTIRWLSPRPFAVKVAAVVAAASVGAVALLLINGPLSFLVHRYTSSALWASGSTPLAYFRMYQEQFGTFWSLFPAVALVGLIRQPRLVSFCLCVFLTAFVLHSFGGMRAERFMFYAMPFFATIWGVAGVALVRRFAAFVSDAVSICPISSNAPVAVSRLVVSGVIGFLILSTPATELTAKMILGRPVRVAGGPVQYWSAYDDTSWSKAQDELRSLISNTNILVTSQGLHALYFLGDFDVELNATRLADFASDFNGAHIDPRTGRLVVADRSALSDIVVANDSGIVVINVNAWRNPVVVSNEVADFIEGNMEKIDLSPDWGLIVYHWDSEHVRFERIDRTP